MKTLANNGWREEKKDGVITFTLLSPGMTKFEWVDHLERKGKLISPWAYEALLSSDFEPCPKGTVHHISVLNGMFWRHEDRTVAKVCEEGSARLYHEPHPETGCIILDSLDYSKFYKMGIAIFMPMHKPIRLDDGKLCYLSPRVFDKKPSLFAYGNVLTCHPARQLGFAFGYSK